MFERYAQLMHRGAQKYEKRNWMKADSQEELDRANESLTRHFFQYRNGETDEDHAAAIIFNLNEIEYIKGRLASAPVCGVYGGNFLTCERVPGHDGKHSATSHHEEVRWGE
jgi:hypothetical protein